MSAAVNAKRTHFPACRSSGLGLVWLLLAEGTMACGPGAVQSALRAPDTISKFALASNFCSRTRPSAKHAVTVERRSSSDASTHSQQLWLYGNPAGTAIGGTSFAAEPSVDVRVRALSDPLIRTAGAPKLPRGVGRDAASRALALVPQISQVAEAYRIDPLLLHAIAHVESRHNPGAVSNAGAVGLMQVMPTTARRFGVTSPHSELRDPRISLEVSSAYLKTLQKRFDNNLPLIIAAYNAGEGAVEKYGRRVPPYKETQGYVRDVLAHYRLLLGARDAARSASRPSL